MDLTRAHMAALATMLTDTGYPVHVGEVTGQTGNPDKDYPYHVIWPPPPNLVSTSLEPTTVDYDIVVQVTSVGRDVDETSAAADRAAVRLVNQRPAIAGRTCALIYQEPLNRPITEGTTRDPVTGRPVYVAVALYRIHSTPA